MDIDVKVAAVLGVAFVTGLSLYLGYNGQIPALAIGIMAGIGGYGIAKKK